ncbi:hypothetical protein BS17DRAFT_815606 [Gyrodon lividus]|nr:hypothetical protein BS17DRAFT_815606 [Gyrodon lividus]
MADQSRSACLIDWESAIFAFKTSCPDFQISRERVLYLVVAAWKETCKCNLPAQQTTAYSKILELVYRQLITPEISSSYYHYSLLSEDAERFGASITDWNPFPDTVAALCRPKKHHFALVVLSNVDHVSFAVTHENPSSPHYPGSAYHTVTPNSPFSLILTAQQVGAYKPNPFMLETALRQLSANPDLLFL